MKTIEPTPSQAAVVLKNYLKELGVELKLSQTQEAIARIHGYASWNTLAADIPVRKSKAAKAKQAASVPRCQLCTSTLNGDFCSNDSCCYADWPQFISREDIKVFADEELEERYAVRKRRAPTQTKVQRKDVDEPARAVHGTCKHCDCLLSQGYCTDEDCPFHHWPQCVSVSDLRCEQSTIEKFYGIRRRDKRQPAPSPLTLAYFNEQSDHVGQDGIDDLKKLLTRELLNTGLLHGWREQDGRGECWFEGDAGPFIQVSFDRRLSKRFTTELVFTLRDHEMQCYVRTWELRDELDHSQDYGIFDERSGDFDTNAEQPAEECELSALVATALAEAELHKDRLVGRFSIQ